MAANVLIYDYGGNTGSIQRALRRLGCQVMLGRKPEAGATHQILPGQGSARMFIGMEIEDSLPTLGICLGMQMLTEGSDEAPHVPGLGWFKGRAVKLPVEPLPHIGWNTINGLADFFFCHSYAVLAANWQLSAYNDSTYRVTQHGPVLFVSTIEKGRHWGIQAHPEKSGDAGMAYLAAFLKC